MPVPVMNVGEMRMVVAQPTVLMLVTVRLLAVPRKRVLVAMMLIVAMSMRMQQGLMNVLVLMMLGYVQPDPHAHAGGRKPKREVSRLAGQHHRSGSADKWRGGEIRARPGRAELPQSHDILHEADAIPEKPDNQRRRHVGRRRKRRSQRKRQRGVGHPGHETLDRGQYPRIAR